MLFFIVNNSMSAASVEHHSNRFATNIKCSMRCWLTAVLQSIDGYVIVIFFILVHLMLAMRILRLALWFLLSCLCGVAMTEIRILLSQLTAIKLWITIILLLAAHRRFVSNVLAEVALLVFVPAIKLVMIGRSTATASSSLRLQLIVIFVFW